MARKFLISMDYATLGARLGMPEGARLVRAFDLFEGHAMDGVALVFEADGEHTPAVGPLPRTWSDAPLETDGFKWLEGEITRTFVQRVKGKAS